jgi:DNA-binding transcriptional ArsR family regulator
MDKFLKSIANKKRLDLIMCLSKPHSVNQMLNNCDLSQSALSQHLIKLKDAGVVSCRKSGNKQIYEIKNKKILNVAKLLIDLNEK